MNKKQNYLSNKHQIKVENRVLTEKLQKVLARLGKGSRREIETWIVAGRIKVNGKVAKLGDRVAVTDSIKVDNKLMNTELTYNSPTRVIIYNKPEGEICTRHDPIGRKTVFNSLPRIKNGRWVSIGRLDIKTEGLLLLTNNGEIANRMMHPSYQIEREYAVRVFGKVDENICNRLCEGVELEDGIARFERIEDGGGTGQNHWYYVVIKEGRKREVRRLWESQNINVNRLIRIRFGDIVLPRELRPGLWEEMSSDSIKALATTLGLALDPTIEHRKVRKSNYIRSKQRLRARERKSQHEEQGDDLVIEQVYIDD